MWISVRLNSPSSSALQRMPAHFFPLTISFCFLCSFAENRYYNAKGDLEDDVEAALSGFQEVVSMEDEKGEWGFKAYKQMVKLHFRQGKHKEMMDSYKQMLTYIKTAVTRNYSEKVINKVLDLVSGSQQMELLQEFYETTLTALQEAKNDRLWRARHPAAAARRVIPL